MEVLTPNPLLTPWTWTIRALADYAQRFKPEPPPLRRREAWSGGRGKVFQRETA